MIPSLQLTKQDHEGGRRRVECTWKSQTFFYQMSATNLIIIDFFGAGDTASG